MSGLLEAISSFRVREWGRVMSLRTLKIGVREGLVDGVHGFGWNVAGIPSIWCPTTGGPSRATGFGKLLEILDVKTFVSGRSTMELEKVS